MEGEETKQPEPNPNEGQPEQPAQPAEPAPEPEPVDNGEPTEEKPAEPKPADYPGKKADKEYNVTSRVTGKVIQNMDQKCQKLGITRNRFIAQCIKYGIEEPHGDISW